MTNTENNSGDILPQHEPLKPFKSTVVHGIDFRALYEHGMLPEFEALFSHFIEALDSLSEDNLNDRATKLASECQMLHPSRPSGLRGFEVGAFFMHFWTFCHLIAQCIPHRHIGQKLLVQVFVDLDAAGQSTNEDWKGLPDLDMFTREDWISPTFARVKSDEEVYTLQQWLNFNSFVARHSGTGFPRGLNFAVWEIRHGLEEPLQERPTKDGRQALGFELSHDVEQLLDEPRDDSPLNG
ncbi:hypothetical protein K4K57_003040 [Colletotrichum sp. SAR 10_99]|nr:hypothetical protein K4K55_003278 [Colletotrichum sp. SAR 10_96]KAJ5013253.1 hypothetical protein K4K57_003040 [Colletotrichum sp. SAR 10_99]